MSEHDGQGQGQGRGKGVRFEDQAIDGAVFGNCSMRAATFENVALPDARYTNVNLARARFHDVNMSGVAISDANIDGMTVLGHNVQALIRTGGAGTEALRAFLPTRDFAVSKAFYEALGFPKLHDGEVAIFGIGTGGFILQRYYQKDWAENCMMQWMVEDLDGCWRRIEALDLPKSFGVPAPKAPTMQPWGLRVGFLVDPAGVLWHVAQRREAAPAG